MSETSVDELVALALRSGDESEMYRRAVGTLRGRGDQATFNRARDLVVDGAGERERVLGIEILALLGVEEDSPAMPRFWEQSRPLLESVVGASESARVLKAAITALSDFRARSSTSVVLAHADHPDPMVRSAVARALAPPGVTDDPPPAAVLEAVFVLMEDTDSDVRGWATFALAHFDADTPEVRDALFARIRDDSKEGNIAFEALAGLAARHDPRALEPTIRWLQMGDRLPGDFILDVFAAARELADARCLPALYALREEWGDDPPIPELAQRVEMVAATLERDPRIPGLAAKVETAVATLERQRRTSGLAAAIRECERGSAHTV